MANDGRLKGPRASFMRPQSDVSRDHVTASTGSVEDSRVNTSLTRTDQWTMAIKQHVLALQEADGFEYCVIICDDNDTVSDILGNHCVSSELHRKGVEIGSVWNPNGSDLDGGPYVGSYRVIACGLPICGTVYVVSTKYSDKQMLNVLAKSIGLVAVRVRENDLTLRNHSIMQQALLSHLDYHVILVSRDGTTRAYHPIPLADAVRTEMLQFAKGSPDTDAEITLDDRLYSVVLRTLAHPDGSSPGRVGLFRDITEKRQMEWRMRDTDRVSMLASLSAGIAHEIRNPLTTARGFLQLFAEHHISGIDRRYISLTIQELDRIQKLVKDFMSLARPEQPRLQCVELNRVIEEVIEFMEPEANLCSVTVNLTSGTSPIHVNGDVNQLKQVLLNVLQNALQASPKQSEVTIRTEIKSTYGLIHVEDAGVGMSSEQLAQVFQPFYTTKDAGTGLGLAICRQILKEHNGGIQLQSKLGVGTTVTLKLPLTEN